MCPLSSLSKFSPCVLRLGLAAVVVWFGVSQLHNGAAWIGMVPAWAIDGLHLSAQTIVRINGWFEIIAGTFLAIGVFTRWIAILLTLHVFIIAMNIGNNPTGVRDIGIVVGLFSVALTGSDPHCFEHHISCGDKEL